MQRFLSAAEIVIRDHPAASPQVAELSWRIFSALRTAAPAQGESGRISACRHLDAALAFARSRGGVVGDLADAFAAIEPTLQWKLRPGAETPFREGHANATLVGPKGDVHVGVSLLAPHTQYPKHHHRPEEIYLVMSEGEWFQEQEPWFTPGIGNLVHNSGDMLHAMRSGEQPLLAFWFLWVGQ